MTLIRPLVTLLLLACALPVWAAESLPANSRAGWVCAPCVHTDLDRIYDEPGNCPICGMDLVPRDELVYAAILVFDGVQIIDYTGPYEVFGQAKFYTYTVSPDGGPISTTMDMRVTPHFSLDDAPRPDVMLVPGGHVDDLLTDPRVLAWVRTTAAEADHVLSVCNGAFVLAEAGLLDGLRATTFHKLIGSLANRYPEVEVLRGARFVDNGKIVTSAGLSAGLDASLHVVRKIQGAEAAARLADHLEYDWRSKSAEREAIRVGTPLDDERFHDYDGVYEYEEGERVTVAASPQDRRLHAFLGGARYPLTSWGPDRFLNAGREEVVFDRGDDGEVIGYRLLEDDPEILYRRLEREVDLPEGAWSLRAETDQTDS